jgi:two-component system phosphate regulon response regulator PhoB
MSQTKQYKILVIEAEVALGDLIKLFLSRIGDEVQTATNGRQGIVMAEQNPPDLIILDLMLPDFDGWEFYRRLKVIPALKQVPVLLTEAFSAESIYPEAKRVGMDGYLIKPFTVPELLTARQALLDGKTYYPLDSTNKSGNRS